MATRAQSEVVFAARSSGTPWTISAGIAAAFAAIMAAGVIWGLLASIGILIAAAVLLLVALGVFAYALHQRSQRPTLEVRTDGLGYTDAVTKGFTVDSPHSEVAWTQVATLTTVHWHGWPWLGIRCRQGAEPVGPAWKHFAAENVYVLTTLSAWGVTPDQLRDSLRRASGLEWADELSVQDAPQPR